MRRHLVYASIEHHCYVTVSQTDLDPDPLRSPQHDVGRQWRFIFVGLYDVCAYTREITLASQRESYTNTTRWSRPGKKPSNVVSDSHHSLCSHLYDGSVPTRIPGTRKSMSDIYPRISMDYSASLAPKTGRVSGQSPVESLVP
jgi:hypothetical protein